MADSVRQEILNEIETILSSLATLKHVEKKKISPVDLETVPFPCAFIFSGAEQKLNDGRAVIGYENWLWRVTVEVWGKDQDMEALLKEIHDLMWTNRNIGGHAITSDRVGADFLVVDVEQSIEAILIDFDILYRNTKGVM
jgi:hypothetical protein